MLRSSFTSTYLNKVNNILYQEIKDYTVVKRIFKGLFQYRTCKFQSLKKYDSVISENCLGCYFIPQATSRFQNSYQWLPRILFIDLGFIIPEVLFAATDELIVDLILMQLSLLSLISASNGPHKESRSTENTLKWACSNLLVTKVLNSRINHHTRNKPTLITHLE